ncbi:hypothetical protein N7925_19635 [Streptomyces sp. CA-278952]|uniref:hypothetical protein n=1 Tax=unclassified Streptomyces TaxID=2593676 RepID=UPI0023682D53|nr:hypothetical protein [Streptomyces sp. CA-278952]WDG30390.1 hypothetical protein N7925_19635 [Streptomyces sp. CA-278952]
MEPHELRSGEHELDTPLELLWRQINPSHIENGVISKLAFVPGENDKGQLSTARSKSVTAQAAFEHHTVVLQLGSIGSYAVTVGEIIDAGLRAVDDSAIQEQKPPTPGHTYVDYRSIASKNQRKKLGAKLRDKAVERGCQYNE